jgi:hypothetical protein
MRVFPGRFGRRVLVLAAAQGVAAGASFATAAITSSSATRADFRMVAGDFEPNPVVRSLALKSNRS